jgi:hypothetical protein
VTKREPFRQARCYSELDGRVRPKQATDLTEILNEFEMTKIIVRRKNAIWQDRARKYTVLLNEKEIAGVSNGSEVEFDVEPGRHTVQMQIDWCHSRKFEIDVPIGKPVILECGPNASPLSALFYITVWKNKYIWLREWGQV